MKILIVRHAPAGKPDPEAWPDDRLRPLTAEGRKAFVAAARGLARFAPLPAAILSSPALRALETARILSRAFDLPRKDIVLSDALLPESPARSALAALRRLLSTSASADGLVVAVVGHEPHLGRLASLLVSGATDASLPLSKGGACLVKAASASAGAGSLAWMLSRDHLRTLSRRA